MKRLLLFLLPISVMLSGCQKQQAPDFVKPTSEIISNNTGTNQPSEGKELFALAETEEEAKSIAELYGIELVEFSYGVAIFHTEEAPQTVIQRGEGKDWPQLSVNQVITLTDPVKPVPAKTQ